MSVFTAKEAKNRFGQLLDAVQREPVTITKNGRAVAMMLSASDDSMIAAVESFLEERYWGERVAEAARGGYIGARECNRILSEALSAED